MDLRVIDDRNGKSFEVTRTVITTKSGESAPSEFTRVNVIPVEALGMYMKLLHCDSLDEAARFILFIRDNQIDTSVTNPWPPAYEQLAYDNGEIDELTLGGFNKTRELLGLPLKQEGEISLMAASTDRTSYLRTAQSEFQSFLSANEDIVDMIDTKSQQIVDSLYQKHVNAEEVDDDGTAV